MEQTEKEIRETVKKLFKEKKIDVFVGFSKGSLPLRSTPCFITEQTNIEKLVWNFYCSNNLAVYLPRFFPVIPPKLREKFKHPRVGILAKGCDIRSIVGLIKEKQIPRENIYIVGVNCDGMIDMKKIQDTEIAESKEKDNKITIVDENKKEIELEKEDLLADVCFDCQYKTPLVYDILIGDKKQSANSERSLSRRSRGTNIVEEFEKKPIQERWEYFKEQISKCIRCYACRQACPNCYCKECFAEQTNPRWIGITNNISDIMFYQIGRILHQAGRCIDCGACVRACPMGIDLRMFTYKLIKDTKEIFGYEAGISLEDLPPLATFKLEDKQEFITEP